MNITELGAFGAVAGAGLIAGFWDKLKSFLERAMSFLFVTIRISTNEMRKATVDYCSENYYKVAFGDRIFADWFIRIKSLGRQRYVIYENMGQNNIFWRGIFPIFVRDGDGSDKNDTAGAVTNYVRFIRGTLNVDEFMLAVMDKMNRYMDDHEKQKGNKRFQIIRYHGDGPLKMQTRGVQPGSPTGSAVKSDGTANVFTHAARRYFRWGVNDFGEGTDMQQYIFSETAQQYIAEIGQWVRGENWYKERNIPWRRGWCLQGQTGTGKTTLVKAAAIKYDLPVCLFDLPSMSNQDLLDAWRRAQSNAPCIALFEDIDATFNKRVNILGENGGGLTFDCLLNCMSGIETASGVFIIVTTNHMENLDPALGVLNENGESTRPGRLDRIIELGEFNTECRRRLADQILLGFDDLEIETIVSENHKDTVVQFQNRCTQHALTRYWNKDVAPQMNSQKAIDCTIFEDTFIRSRNLNLNLSAAGKGGRHDR